MQATWHQSYTRSGALAAWLSPEMSRSRAEPRPGAGSWVRHINQYPEVTSPTRLCVANLSK